LNRKSPVSKPPPRGKTSALCREIYDGVAKIEGLTDCMANEMLDFGWRHYGLRR
jgi:F0F1-type ATP synthase alpha subunit